MADDEVWLILAKERLQAIPEYNESLAYILEDEDFVMDHRGDLEEEAGKFEMEGDLEEEAGKFKTDKEGLAADSDLDLPMRELEELREKAKNVTEALR